MVSERTSLTRQPIATRGVEGYFDLSVCLHPRPVVCRVITSWNQQMEVSNNIVHAALMIWCKYFKLYLSILLHNDYHESRSAGIVQSMWTSDTFCGLSKRFYQIFGLFDFWYFKWTQNYKFKLWQALIDFIFITHCHEILWPSAFLLDKHVYRIKQHIYYLTGLMY